MNDLETIRTQILQAKETRWQKQQEFVQQYHSIIISFKFNIPSWPKTSELISSAFENSLQAFIEFSKTHFPRMPLLLLETNETVLGPEAFFKIDALSKHIKTLTIEFEETHPLGRLLDIDVLNNKGMPVERTIKRTCYLCDNIAIHCMREKKHTTNELRSFFDGKIKEFLEVI